MPANMIVEKQDLWGRRYILINAGCPVLRTRATINKFFDALPSDVEIVGMENYGDNKFKLTLTSSAWNKDVPYPELKLKISHELKVEVS